MKKAKLLKALKDLKVKLECRKRRFELWQEQLETERITEENITKSHMYWTKQRRLEERIEAINQEINTIEKNKYSLQIFMYRRTMNENI